MKIFCIGRNYQEHINELNNETPVSPVVFMKPKSAIARKGFPIPYPTFTEDLQYEAEVVIQIKKNGKKIEVASAHEYYDTWTLGIDFTARDIQNKLKSKGLPWELAKSFDNSAVVGEFMPINNRIQNTAFKLLINDDAVQEGNTKDMIFSIDRIISYISQYFSIQMGDLIFTGTPAGVGSILPFDEVKGYLDGKEVFNTIIKE